MAETIRPALEAGVIVLCDRFTDASAAYQGAGRGIAGETVEALNRIATSGLAPDLTLLFDLPAAAALARVAARGRPDRLEAEAIAFHEKVRAGYLELAAASPKRFRRIDADRPVGPIAGEVLETILALA